MKHILLLAVSIYKTSSIKIIMKKILLITFSLLTLYSFSQKTVTAYIEARASIDILGNIYLNNILEPKKLSRVDSLINYSQVNQIINLREPIKIINKLSENGWTLVTVTNILSDKEGRPNSPIILYYFKKNFELLQKND